MEHAPNIKLVIVDELNIALRTMSWLLLDGTGILADMVVSLRALINH